MEDPGRSGAKNAPTEGMLGAEELGDWHAKTTPANIAMRAKGDVQHSSLHYTSDGSVNEAACEVAVGAYGWVARLTSAPTGWGDFEVVMVGVTRVPFS